MIIKDYIYGLQTKEIPTVVVGCGKRKDINKKGGGMKICRWA